MSLLQKILFFISPKEIGRHFKTFSQLYVNPIKIYKKVLSNREKSYEFVVYSVYYYGLFIFLLINNLLTTVQLVLFEILITLVPFFIFIIPFNFFKKQFKKRVKWSSFFRLLLIIKIQLVPIVALIALLLKWSGAESLYIIIENSIWIIWMCFIIILPLVIRINFYYKLIWILTNYIFFLIFFLIFSTIVGLSSDFDKLFNKLSSVTPSMEYLEFQIETKNATNYIHDSLFLIITEEIKVNNENVMVVDRSQYVSAEIELAFITSESNILRSEIKRRLKENQRLKDSLGLEKDTIINSHQFDSIELVLYPKENELSLKKLNIINDNFTEIVESDIELAKKYMDSTKFEINRKYYKALYDYLQKYKNSYTDINNILKILKVSELKKSIRLGTKYAVLYEIPNNTYEPEKTLLANNKAELDNFTKKSNFLMDIFFKPLDILFY